VERFLYKARAQEDSSTFLGEAFGLGWEFITDAADKTANQVVNCFAFDGCDELAKEFEVWRNPGTGRALSPDDMLFWDPPPVGVYGHNERLVYRSGVYERVHRFLPSAGTGTVRGVVLRNGEPQAGARVILANLPETASAADGSFEFLAVPAGSYVIEAQLVTDDFFAGKVTITLDAGETENVTLELSNVEQCQEVVIHKRRVEFTGFITTGDDDGTDGFTVKQEPLNTACEVSPQARTQTLRFVQCNDEVMGVVVITCTLLDDDVDVDVTVKGELWEETECPNDDLEGELKAGPFRTGPCDAGCEPGGALIEITNKEADSRDFLKVWGGVEGQPLEWRNFDGGVVEPLCVEDDNRRVVTFSGDGFILDSDEFGNPDDRVPVEIIQECLVDPFDPIDEWHFSECVDDEVRVELKVKCQLADDKKSVIVETDARLFEGSTCNTEDQDGSTTGAFTFAPVCEPTCSPGSINIELLNEDEGGDRFELNLTVQNNQQF